MSLGAFENIKNRRAKADLRALPFVALVLAVVLAAVGMWAYANSNVAYDETAPVTIKQESRKLTRRTLGSQSSSKTKRVARPIVKRFELLQLKLREMRQFS